MKYTKLDHAILESTIWREPDATLRVWIAFLAMSDWDGNVFASVPGLADRARVTIEQCESALECFLGPDKYSRTPENDGRRIEKVRGGWRLLNFAQYRDTSSNEQHRERNRERNKRYRERKKGPEPSSPVTSRDVTRRHIDSDLYINKSSKSSCSRDAETSVTPPELDDEQRRQFAALLRARAVLDGQHDESGSPERSEGTA